MSGLQHLKYASNTNLKNLVQRSNSTVNKITINSDILKKFRFNKLNSGKNLCDSPNTLHPYSSAKSTKKQISLEKMFKHPQIYRKDIFKFYKITKPKLPFSKRIVEDKETKKLRLIHKKPSRIFQDCNTINWFRQKFSDKMIEKSIYSLLPEVEKPVIPENESEEDKRHREMIMFLNSLKGPKGREKYLKINPKYFYNSKTFQTILKLKKIFLEFDEDGNRRMEIDEMYKMFNENHISVNFNDLADLFFNGRKFRKEDIMKLYLNFYQFLKFALNKDADYRKFMRNIKKKTGKKGEYLPMNFNATLDYFIFKGKERSSKEIIKKALEEMDKVINIDKQAKVIKPLEKNSFRERKRTTRRVDKPLKPTSKNLSSNNVLRRRDSKLYSFEKMSKDVKNLHYRMRKKSIINIADLVKDIVTYDLDYDDQLKKINFNQLIKEFYNLFNLDNGKFGSDDSNNEIDFYDIYKENKKKIEFKKKLKDSLPNSNPNSINKKSSYINNNINSKKLKIKKSNSCISKGFEKTKLLYLNSKKGLDSIPSPSFNKKNNNITTSNTNGIFVTNNEVRNNLANKKTDFDYVPLKLLEPPKKNFTKYISNSIQDSFNLYND